MTQEQDLLWSPGRGASLHAYKRVGDPSETLCGIKSGRTIYGSFEADFGVPECGRCLKLLNRRSPTD